MPTPVAEAIASARDALEITQEELAARITAAGYQVSTASVGHWETGRRSPHIRAVPMLRAVFGWDEDAAAAFISQLMSPVVTDPSDLKAAV